MNREEFTKLIQNEKNVKIENREYFKSRQVSMKKNIEELYDNCIEIFDNQEIDVGVLLKVKIVDSKIYFYAQVQLDHKFKTITVLQIQPEAQPAIEDYFKIKYELPKDGGRTHRYSKSHIIDALVYYLSPLTWNELSLLDN